MVFAPGRTKLDAPPHGRARTRRVGNVDRQGVFEGAAAHVLAMFVELSLVAPLDIEFFSHINFYLPFFLLVARRRALAN